MNEEMNDEPTSEEQAVGPLEALETPSEEQHLLVA